MLKNTVDLEPAEVQAAAKEKLDALVLSYQHLDSLLDMAREGNSGGCRGASSSISPQQQRHCVLGLPTPLSTHQGAWV